MPPTQETADLLSRDSRYRRPSLSRFLSSSCRWQSRRRDNGTVAFDDGVGEVSGTWVTGRPPRQPWRVGPHHGR